MGWTDDPDTEGLFEENLFVAIIIGVVLLAVAGILHFVGIGYDPGWFEGQQLISTIGIIFLLVFIPAIALSTATGKSDLVKWEALFLLIAIGMIYVGNNFDFQSFFDAFSAKISDWMNIEWDVMDLISIVLIVAIIAGAISVAFGKGFGMGSAVLVLACIVGLVLVNMEGGFFENIGEGINQAVGGALGFDLGNAAKGAGIGGAIALGVGVVLTATGVGAPIGIPLMLAAGAIAGGTWGAFDFPPFNLL